MELPRDTKLTFRDYEYGRNLSLNKIRYFQIAVDPANIAANSSGETAVTIRKVQVGDMVFAAPPPSLEAGLSYSGCRVSAADTVQLRLNNVTGSGVDGASRTWEFLVLGISAD